MVLAVCLRMLAHTAGKRDGEEVVQVYVKQPQASVPVPRVRLADFARVPIKAGETVRVTLFVRPQYRFVVPAAASMWSPGLAIEAGAVQVSVGGGQPDYYAGALRTSVAVSGAAPLDSCK